MSFQQPSKMMSYSLRSKALCWRKCSLIAYGLEYLIHHISEKLHRLSCMLTPAYCPPLSSTDIQSQTSNFFNQTENQKRKINQQRVRFLRKEKINNRKWDVDQNATLILMWNYNQENSTGNMHQKKGLLILFGGWTLINSKFLI